VIESHERQAGGDALPGREAVSLDTVAAQPAAGIQQGEQPVADEPVELVEGERAEDEGSVRGAEPRLLRTRRHGGGRVLRRKAAAGRAWLVRAPQPSSSPAGVTPCGKRL
jgi:hypothetical protein